MYFNDQVNERRTANNLIFVSSAVEGGLPDELSYMRFQIPGRYQGLRAADIRAVTSYLESASGSFLLIGDNTVLNGLTGKPSVIPALYLVGGLTIPAIGTHELAAFERLLLYRLRQANVRRVVLERRTWEGVSLANFPRLGELIQACRGAVRKMGFFEVIELKNRAGCTSPRLDR